MSTRRIADLTKGNGRAGDADFIQPQAQQQGLHRRIAGDFTADGDGDAGGAAGLAGHGDQAKDGGVERGCQRGDSAVYAVRGECILGQIVGADAEKIDLRREVMRQESSGRYFDQDAYFEGAELLAAMLIAGDLH